MDSCFSFSCLFSQFITVGGKRISQFPKTIVTQHRRKTDSSVKQLNLSLINTKNPKGQEIEEVLPFSLVFNTSLLSFNFCNVVSNCSFSFKTCKPRLGNELIKRKNLYQL